MNLEERVNELSEIVDESDDIAVIGPIFDELISAEELALHGGDRRRFRGLVFFHSS